MSDDPNRKNEINKDFNKSAKPAQETPRQKIDPYKKRGNTARDFPTPDKRRKLGFIRGVVEAPKEKNKTAAPKDNLKVKRDETGQASERFNKSAKAQKPPLRTDPKPKSLSQKTLSQKFNDASKPPKDPPKEKSKGIDI